MPAGYGPWVQPDDELITAIWVGNQGTRTGYEDRLPYDSDPETKDIWTEVAAAPGIVNASSNPLLAALLSMGTRHFYEDGVHVDTEENEDDLQIGAVGIDLDYTQSQATPYEPYDEATDAGALGWQFEGGASYLLGEDASDAYWDYYDSGPGVLDNEVTFKAILNWSQTYAESPELAWGLFVPSVSPTVIATWAGGRRQFGYDDRSARAPVAIAGNGAEASAVLPTSSAVDGLLGVQIAPEWLETHEYWSEAEHHLIGTGEVDIYLHWADTVVDTADARAEIWYTPPRYRLILNRPIRHRQRGDGMRSSVLRHKGVTGRLSTLRHRDFV